MTSSSFKTALFRNAASPSCDQQSMFIRDFIAGEEAKLRQIFSSSVHGLACDFYAKDQLDAWAPQIYDERQWAEKVSLLRPFVAVVDGRVAGYADLQDSGRIEHFFVSGKFPRRGVGSALMEHIHQAAVQRRLSGLSAHVSLAAESFFAKHGFRIAQRQVVAVRGVSMSNFLMVKRLLDGGSFGPTASRGRT